MTPILSNMDEYHIFGCRIYDKHDNMVCVEVDGYLFKLRFFRTIKDKVKRRDTLDRFNIVIKTIDGTAVNNKPKK